MNIYNNLTMSNIYSSNTYTFLHFIKVDQKNIFKKLNKTQPVIREKSKKSDKTTISRNDTYTNLLSIPS